MKTANASHSALPDLVLCEFAETGLADVASFSPFCGKVIQALRAAGLPYTSRRAHDPGEFRALNPVGQLPILLVDGVPLTDSTRIVRKLVELRPSAFPGNGEAARGEAHLWEELADTHLNGFLVAARWADEANWPSVRQAYFGAAPWFVRALIAPRIRAKVVSGLRARDVWRAGPDACWESFAATLDALEARAPVDDFWLSSGFSTADLALAAQLDGLRTPLTPRQATLVAARPRLARWLDRVDAAVRRGPARVLSFDASLTPVFVDPALHAAC
jgi:glutathione S-transferase